MSTNSSLEPSMKLSIPQTSLAAGLSLAARLVNHRSTLPVLADVLLISDETGLKLAASDLVVSLALQLDAQVERIGSICVSARSFTELVNTFPHERVDLQLRKNELEVACGKTKASLYGMSASEFPPLYEAQVSDGITLPAQKIKSMIQQVVFAASVDDSRVILTGVHLIINDDVLTLVASDGYRLSESKVVLDAPSGKKLQYLVPARTVSELSRLIGQAEQITLSPTLNHGQLAFVLPTCTLISQLVEGNYFDYEVLMPKRHVIRAVMSTAALLTACKQVDIFARESGQKAKLSFRPGSLKISDISSEIGSVSSTLDAEVVGGELDICFNVAYLREGLQAIHTASVAIEATVASNVAVFRPVGEDGFTHILSPMYLSA